MTQEETESNIEAGNETQAKNSKVVFRLVLTCIGFFIFAVWLMPKFYEVFCEVTGLNGKIELSAADGRVRIEDLNADQNIDSSRTITVEFVADVAPDLPWTLKAETTQVKVHPGEMKRINFYAENRSGRDIVARAVPSVSPGHGAAYLQKVQCFCFDEMALAAGEKQEMPMVFHLTEDFPDDIATLTLAYKAFDVTDKVKVVEYRADEKADVEL